MVEKSNKPEDFPIFLQPDVSEMEKMLQDMAKFLESILPVIGIENVNEIDIDRETMYKIFTRIEKRRVYFHIYYDGLKMGELNEAALTCFWILKLMPFKHNTISNTTLNVKIAFSLFMNVITYVADQMKRKINDDPALMTNLLYAFQYRDLSKEALMAIAESFLYEEKVPIINSA